MTLPTYKYNDEEIEEQTKNILKLIDIDTINEAREQADLYRKEEELNDSDIEYLRARAKTDLFFLSDAVLGYKELSTRLHGNMCKWINSTHQYPYRLLLMPRGHFKTTVSTIGESIQAVLPSMGGLLGPRNLSGNLRLLLAHESNIMASRFLIEITQHFCRNPKLMTLFPELIPDPRKHRINQAELELPRTAFWAEPTFDTIGVGGKGQGRHYDWIKLDDIFGDKARDSQAERDTTIQWFDNIQAFFTSLVSGYLDVVGTRYSLDDVYDHMMKVYGDVDKGLGESERQFVRYIRRIREKQVVKNSESGEEETIIAPIFPERFPEKKLRILQRNRIVWTAQYVNDPQEGLARWDKNWKRFWNVHSPTSLAVFTGESRDIIKFTDLDRLIFFDPATTGGLGITVTGTDAKRIYILEAIKKDIPLTQQVDVLFRLVMKWQPRYVVIEEVLFSATYKPWFEAEMKLRNHRFLVVMQKIKDLVPGHKDKLARIDASLQMYFSAGQIYFNEGQTDLIDEFDRFGASEKNIHLLDSLANGPLHWRFGFNVKQFEHYRELETEMLSESRDPVTGYSVQ